MKCRLGRWNDLTEKEIDIVVETAIETKAGQILLTQDEMWNYLSQVEGQQKGPSQDGNQVSTIETDQR